MSSPILFPEGFLWGAAVSAYQVEGSPLAEGAGASVWHRFSHTPGLVSDGETGDVACDFYRRYGDDVRLMRELGLRPFASVSPGAESFPRVAGASAGGVSTSASAWWTLCSNSASGHS